jgi:hypothetical protein
MKWDEDVLEGDVDPTSKEITWSNGFIHRPTLSTGLSPGDKTAPAPNPTATQPAEQITEKSPDEQPQSQPLPSK